VVDPDSGRITWVPEDPFVRGEHTVFRYRPRTEGLFARIERWVHTTTGETHWRTITKDNITSLFGNTAGTRLADPAGDRRVYEWLLHETFDVAGNHSLCEYAADDPALYGGGDPDGRLPEIFERHRVASNRYPRRFYYGNLPEPLLDPQQRPLTYPDGTAVGHLRNGRRYAFEVVFDYGDWDLPTVLPHPEPPPADQQELFGGDRQASTTRRPVPVRADRFSHFRAGFEVRTLRRCRRVLMFHHLAEMGGPTLVRSTDFSYTTDADTRVSLLSAATVTGYDKDGQGQYRWASMPPVAFSYAGFRPQEQRYQSLTALGGVLPALALNDPTMALVDLFGDGLPDILQTGPDGFRYWRNLGNATLDRPRTLPDMPAGISLDQPGIGFGDMAGNGIADLLVNTPRLAGFFETTSEGAWKRFTPYETAPGFAPQDPNTRMLDLTGNGRSDALMTRDQQFLWFPCLGEEGFGPPQSITRSHDLDQFPDVFFDDPAGRVRLADMTGDGLSDIVTVHNGRIDYWPNLGYGRFGNRVSMANAPQLDIDFDPRRLFLADLNGTGCSDLVYVDFQRVHFWFNQSGNGWSERQTIRGTPATSDTSALQFADVFGTGTATLVFSRDFVDTQDGNYKALDFCGGVKPYVLVGMDNNMGATTRVSYAPSTRHFLADMANGAPWITPLPFPVQVVDTVETIDHVSKTRRVCTYKYHHGHYDGREREFCGFGRVDQFDAESLQDSSRPDLHGDGTQFANGAGGHHVPPVETRSWFHTGVYFDDRGTRPLDYRDLTERFRQEYYQHDGHAVPLDEQDVDPGETPAEAYRALRGAQLRTEVYAHDGSAKAEHPYQVSESRYRVAQLQPRSTNKHALYFSHQLESLAYHYERNPADPRISHALTLAVDAFGNPLKTLSIGYGRRHPDSGLPTQADRDRQTRTLVTYTEARFTNAIDDPASPDTYRAPAPAETLSHELTGFAPIAPGAQRFSYAEWVADDLARIDGAPAIGYEEVADPAVPQKRLIERVRTFYRKDDLTDLLPLGVLESLALPGESHRLAFTTGLLTRIYGDRVDDPTLVGCGFVRGDDPTTWWIPSGRVFYSPGHTDAPAAELSFAQRHFFAAHRTRDPFGNFATTRSDPYVLLALETNDAVGNRMLAEQDYRVLQPFRLTDPNGNRAEVAFDTLGFVAGSAVLGKASEALGDSLTGFAANLSPEQRLGFLVDPLTQAAPLLGSATTRIVYDLDRFRRERQPVCASMLTRETHASDPMPAGGLKVQLSLSYSDGFGREVQKKIPAEPGPVVDGGPVVSPRWVGSGWTIFNNKGKPVRQFEPFFDDTHALRFDQRVGVSPTVCYDPLERVVATLRPDHTWEKVVFDPWQQATWDVNDTVLIENPKDDLDVGGLFAGLDTADYLPTWYAARQGGDLGAAEQAAALKTAVHAASPSIAHADALGRPFLTIAHNRFERGGQTIDEVYATRVVLDIENNQREVVDANDRVVMRYDFDMLGTRVRSTSMEAGERWLLHDVVGQPVFAWNSRDQRLRTTYDALRRPVDSFLTDGDNGEQLVGRTVFGESATHPEALNLRRRIFQHLDQAGVVTNEAYDFKGNLLASRRQLAHDYKTMLDWSTKPALDAQVYVTRTAYDALNRPVAVTSPDGSVVRAPLNPAGLLEKTELQLHGATAPTPFVTGIDYDAKGRRMAVGYGNGLRTRHTYDPLTMRLTQCRTFRGTDPVQDLGYVYDPTGNITHIQDDAQQTLYFKNQVVTPTGDYTYDAVYRLRGAEGREHTGQVSQPETTWNDAGRLRLPNPGDGQAMRRYAEQYGYDAVGNLRELVHTAVNGSWTRSFSYDEASLVEPGKSSNRLSSVVVGSKLPERFSYDPHGNLTAMAHLPGMEWDFRDQLRRVDLGGGGTAYYVYDAAGERVRKVVEKNAGNLVEERIILAGFEIFRRRDAAGTVSLERESLHVMDGQQRIALVDTRTKGEEPGVPAQLVRFQLGDHLGSAALELDGAGQIISYEEYYPYGSTSYQAGRSAAEVSLKRYWYTGKERDEETGLNHHGARYYAPWLGRWTSCDPIGIKDGLNAYCSFHDNPLVFKDPNGMQNEPANFVEYASTVKGGLERMKKLGVADRIEYGLAGDSASGKLMILKGTKTEVAFGDLIPLGHSHTGKDTSSVASTTDLNEFARKGVKEHWIFGKEDGWARYKYDAKTQSFDVRLVRPEGTLNFKITLNPNFNPKDTSPIGRASKWISSGADSGSTASPELPPLPRLPPTRARVLANTTLKVAGIAGVASVAGEVIKDLHEGKPGRAAVTAGVATGLGYAFKRYPPAMVFAAAAATIMAYDDKVKKQANAAGEALDDYLGFSDHTVIGGLAAAEKAVEKSVYNGVIKPIGTGIGEGAAAAYIRLTSDEYTLNPFKAEWFPW